MNGSFDVLIVGVGGQGTILASNVLGEACLIENKPVRAAETHGMAQRGGSVESHVRVGCEFGPLISPGTADLILAFDMLEALRASHFLKEGGLIIASLQLIVPVSVYMKKLDPPTIQSIRNALMGKDAIFIDAEECAVRAGSPLTTNMVIIGAASPLIPLSLSSLKKAVAKRVPAKTLEINDRAFEIGREEYLKAKS